MPNRCVSRCCGHFLNLELGIVLHAFPFYGDKRPIAKRTRCQWVEFVKAKCAKWEPTPSLRLCSAHFKPEDFMRRFSNLQSLGQPVIPWLIRDEIGVLPVPTIHSTLNTTVTDRPDASSGLSAAQRRRQSCQVSGSLNFALVQHLHAPF